MIRKLKKAIRNVLKGVLPKTVYCIYVDKKHEMKYRSTILVHEKPIIRMHVNTCDNCKAVKYVYA